MNMMSNMGLCPKPKARTEIDQRRSEMVERAIAKHLGANAGSSKYDSAVIAGNGMGALTFAARLSRHPQFEGKITVVAPPVMESRRLINGVSLRGIAADYLCAALDCTHGELLDEIADTGAGQPVAYRQIATMATRGRDGRFGFSQARAWHGGKRGLERPIIYGVRNSRITGAMSDMLAQSPIDFIQAKAESADHMRDMAKGSRPLLVNATVMGGLLGAQTQKPSKMVLAVQVPFIVESTGLRGPVESGAAFAPLVRRDGIIDVGYFTPFSDPLSPRSSWYGIIARVVDAGSGFDKDKELDIMTEELFGIGQSIGLVPDDPEETLARALVPASDFGKIAPSAPGTLELKRAYSGGAPCYYADGMISAAMGGVLAADAVATGRDPDDIVRDALRAYRWHNRLWWIETTKIAGLADLLMRVNVNLAMAYPHTSGVNLWASHA